MKTLLAILALAASALIAQAQTTTNLDVRIREILLEAGVPANTNTVNFSLDSANKKEALMVDGFAMGFAQYRANGGTNDFPAWLRIDFRDRAKAYQDAKQAADNAVLLSKLQALLLGSPDLLSNADITSLNTIAAKAP